LRRRGASRTVKPFASRSTSRQRGAAFASARDQFTRSAWLETPKREWRSRYRRALVIELGGVEVIVEEVEDI
jgi:hypothetical protein